MLSEDEDSSDESKGDDYWEDECYVCKKGGDVMCCDGCRKVCHFECTGLTRKPRDNWLCKYCVEK